MVTAAKDDQKVAAAVEAAAISAKKESEAPPNEWESTQVPGLRFKVGKVSKYALMAVRKNIQRPMPPIVYIEEKGREESNPQDPDYILSMMEYQMNRSIATVDTYLALGTSLLAKPDSLAGPDEPEKWAPVFESLGLEIPAAIAPRYVFWIKMFAVTDDDDIAGLISTARRYNGIVLEEEVEEALDDLKSDDGRSADPPATTSEVASTDFYH